MEWGKRRSAKRRATCHNRVLNIDYRLSTRGIYIQSCGMSTANIPRIVQDKWWLPPHEYDESRWYTTDTPSTITWLTFYSFSFFSLHHVTRLVQPYRIFGIVFRGLWFGFASTRRNTLLTHKLREHELLALSLLSSCHCWSEILTIISWLVKTVKEEPA